MTLTFPGGPLSASPPDSVNYSIEGPKHRLLAHPHPRRIRARLGDETVLDTTAGFLLHETAILPRFYFPEADLRSDLLEPSELSTHCPFKGDASYWSIRAGESFAEDAVWTYREPIEESSWLKGLVSVYPEKMDVWLEEDEELLGHLRDPYHRVDARPSSRKIEIRRGDQVIARTDTPVAVFETGLPPRWYLQPEDLLVDLEPSKTTAICPYKGEATYFSTTSEAGEIEDVAWTYAEPLEGVHIIEGLISFLHDELTTEISED